VKIGRNSDEGWYSTWVDFTDSGREYGFNAYGHSGGYRGWSANRVILLRNRIHWGDSYKITHPDWPTLARTAPPEVLTDWLLDNGPEPLRRRLEELLTYAGVGHSNSG